MARLEERMRVAGFRDIKSKNHKVPVGPWSSTESLQLIGELNLKRMGLELETMCMRLFGVKFGVCCLVVPLS